MKKLIAAGALMAGMLTSAQASAAQYVLEAKGTVAEAIRSTGNPDDGFTPLVGGLFSLGDSFSVKITFDTDRALLASLFAANPSINIYYLPGAKTTIQSGQYISNYTNTGDFSANIQFWDNYDVVGPTDSQSYSTSNYNFSGAVPFDLGGGLNFETVTVGSYDSTANVRSSDSINDLLFSSAPFNGNLISYTFSTGVTPGAGQRPVALVEARNVSWTLTEVNAVPEPATWMLMLTGMMMTGYALRRRRAVFKAA